EKEISLEKILHERDFSELKSAFMTRLPDFIFCGLVFWFTEVMEPKTWIPGGSSTFRYLITQPFVLSHYFITFFLPITLNADTDWSTYKSIFDVRVLVGLVFIGFLVFVATITYRDRRLRPICFGIAWFIIALIPTSSIIPLAEVLNYHRLFFSYVGL